MKLLIGSIVFVAASALILAGCDKSAVFLDVKDGSVTHSECCVADDAAASTEVVDAGAAVVEPKTLVAPVVAPLTGDAPKAVSVSATPAVGTAITTNTKK